MVGAPMLRFHKSCILMSGGKDWCNKTYRENCAVSANGVRPRSSFLGAF